LPAFDSSGIWDPGMDRLPPSRAEAVRIGRQRGEALGGKVLPAGAQRRLQPIVDKFFYSLMANTIETQRLGLWWANRMLATKRPLEEKLTLFWHGHFATGQAKVRDARTMQRQNEMLRANASRSLRESSRLSALSRSAVRLLYSPRSAFAGSTRAAVSAGIILAIPATISRIATAATYAIGSTPLTP
jgi:hypothetical protein